MQVICCIVDLFYVYPARRLCLQLTFYTVTVINLPLTRQLFKQLKCCACILKICFTLLPPDGHFCSSLPVLLHLFFHIPATRFLYVQQSCCTRLLEIYFTFLPPGDCQCTTDLLYMYIAHLFAIPANSFALCIVDLSICI